jgi:hypothetical protein
MHFAEGFDFFNERFIQAMRMNYVMMFCKISKANEDSLASCSRRQKLENRALQQTLIIIGRSTAVYPNK